MSCSTVCTIGELNDRITIQENTNSTPNDFGEVTNTWTDITDGTVCAKVEYKGTGSNEDYKESQEVASTVVVFTIRYKSEVTAKMRISYESAFWDIESIAVQDNKRWTELTAKKQDS